MSWTRGAALAAMAGGALLLVANAVLLVDPDARGHTSAGDYPTVFALTAGALLVCAGLAAVHGRERAVYGTLGLIGFTLALVAQLATAAFVATTNELPYLIGVLAGVIGFVLLTIAIVRAPAAPRWSGYLAFVAFVGLLFVGDADLGFAAAGVAWLVVGYALRTDGEPAVTPAPTRA